ncbi:MAG: nucleotide exchange factor GrpE [Proteobacteria bacterium]|nr:MAG: nucleotide exchange factor GrpE [Pseudomonadota bacterium]
MQEKQTPDAHEQAPAIDVHPADEAASTAAAEATAATHDADTMPSLEETLRQAELKASEHHDAWLRAKAETENVRRRAQDDIAKASKFAAEKFAQAMLPVKDSLEAALNAENSTVENLRSGVELTLKQLTSAFEGAGLAVIDPLGEKFDPNLHQAISAQPDDGEPNRVINVLQRGYSLHERVIRPALVIVSAPKAG